MIKILNVLIFSGLFLLTQAQDCEILIPPTNINGIDVTSSFTGTVETYLLEFTSCGLYTMPANSVWLGAYGEHIDDCGNSFTYTLDFSEPVNGFSFILAGSGVPGAENFIFTTNIGNVILNDLGSCNTEIVGNVIFSGLNADVNGGGGFFEAVGTEPFTSITISGDGCHSGTLFGICSETIDIPNLAAEIGPSTTVCVGAPAPQLTLTGNGGNPPYTFSYNINGGANQFANTSSDTFILTAPTNVAGSFTYTITSVEDGDGNVIAANASATVLVNTIVTPSFNTAGPFCAGAVIPALPSQSTNGISGSWSPALNNTATTTYTFTPNTGQCATPTTLTVEVDAVEVDLNPTVAVCPSEPVNFSIVGAAEPNTTYAWNVNGGAISNNNGSSITASFASGGNYTIQVTATEQGCFGIATQPMTVFAAYNDVLNISVCDSYFWNGTEYTESGVHVVDATTAFGCDSITTLNLTVNYSGSSIEQMETCDSYLWNGVSYTESGTYSFLTTTPQGCPFEETLELVINNSTQETINVPICEGSFYELPDGSQVGVSGVYQVFLSTVAGCDSLLIYNIATQTGPEVNFTATPTTTTVFEPDVTFYNLTENSTQVFWDFGAYGSSEEQNPEVTLDEIAAHPICLTAWNDLGCETTACLDYIVTDAFYVYIPNAFTPDNDGINEVFFIQGTNIASDGFDLKIYNRWGEVVFETTNPEAYWIGEGPMTGEYYSQDGVYAYRAVIKDQLTGNSYEFNGFVVVIR